MNNNKEALLFGGTYTEKNKPYYHYCRQDLATFLRDRLPKQNATVVYISWALWGDYSADDMFTFGQEHWSQFGIELSPLHRAPNRVSLLEQAHMIIVGSGSVHQLVESIHEHNLMNVLRESIEAGTSYIGTSAGAVIAGPTMHTATEPHLKSLTSAETLSIVPFQIQPHYRELGAQEPGPTSKDRAMNFLFDRARDRTDLITPVVCLYDGAYLNVDNNRMTTHGVANTTVFYLEESPGKNLGVALRQEDFPPGTNVSVLLNRQSHYFYRMNGH